MRQGQCDGRSELFLVTSGFPREYLCGGCPSKSGGIAERIRNGVAVRHPRSAGRLVLTQSIRKNSAPCSPWWRYCTRWSLVKEDEERTQVAEQMDSLQIKASSMEELVSHLSGGNQQKVMLARWLMTKPRVLIIDEPTKGIDIGARMSIYQIIHQLTEAGIGILMLTSDMVELIGLSDRTLVFYEGKIVKELSRGEITEERVMTAASGMTEE
ncbi:MAG: ATP-binding cassette domain-containing protein [Oscillospiraceae bacterium]